MMQQYVMHAKCFILPRQMYHVQLQKLLLGLFAASILCRAAVDAQPIRFEFISTEDGLPDATIMCVLKDRQGFLWFGTLKGIARYDGYSFKNFQQNVDDTTSIKGDIIYTMMEDRSGSIWIGSVGGGLNKFDPATEHFTHYQHHPTNPSSISHNDVFALVEDHEGKIWVGTRGGLDVFNPESGGFNHIHPARSETIDHNSKQVSAIYESPATPGILWIGTWGDGFLKYDVQKNSFMHFKTDSTSKNSVSNNFIRFIYQLKGHPWLLWMGTDTGGLNSFDIVHNSFTIYQHSARDKHSISGNGVRSMIEDKHGYIWVGTSGAGLNRFDPAAHRFENYRHHPKDYRSICNNNVLSLYEDETGVIWVGTREGISRFINPKEQFQVYQNDPGNPNSLTNDFLYSLYEDHEGILWISSGKGLNRFDPKNAAFRSYQHNRNDPSSLRNDYVRTIYEDRKRNLWVGNTRGVVHKFSRTTGRSKSITLVVNNKSSDEVEVRAILEERDGTFWVGTSEGLFIVDREKWTSKHVVLGPIGKDSSRPYLISAIYEDNKKFLWVSARNEGILRYNKRNNDIKIFSPESSKWPSILHHTVTHIFEDRAGDLWIATGIGGLEKYNRETETFIPFFKPEGTANNTVYGALEDSSGKFWMGTDNGLYRFDPITKLSRKFSLRHSLHGIGFNSRSFCAGKSGRMYFGGTSGFIVFYPDQIQDNMRIPPIYITKLKVLESDIVVDTSLSHLKNIVLHHDQNFVSFEFAALDFKDPQENRYAYKLEGLDNDWIYSNSRRYAAYTHLDPGTYTFKAKGSNNNGVWNEQGAFLTLTILPPWWRTLWAYAVFIMISGVVGFVFYRNRLAKQNMQHQLDMEHLQAEKLAEVNKLKSRFFANISHEFRTPLTLILGPIERLLQQFTETSAKEELIILQRNAHRLLKMVNQLLEFARLESGKSTLCVSRNSYERALSRFVNLFSSAAVNKQIELRFYPDISEVEGYFDREKLELVMNNLLSNALKFTPAGGTIEVQLHREAETAIITVSDSGIGISPEYHPHVFERFYRVDTSHSVEGTGIGLALCKELVELHKGTITLTSEVGKGTTVTLRLPLEGYDPSVIVPSVEEEPFTVTDVSQTLKEETTAARVKSEMNVVMVVEDNEEARKYICSYLRSDYAVLEAIDGIDGWMKSLQRIPDLVVSDIMMPGINGYELCARMKNDERTSHIPLILLTALADQSNKIEGLKTGADEYLAKPFHAEELLTRIANLIANRKKIQDRYARAIPLKPGEVAVTSLDDAFLQKAMASVVTHMTDEQFGIEQFAREVFLSRAQLFRKLKALTGFSPNDFIRHIRLMRAKELLEKQAGSIADIAAMVGFTHYSYFAKRFKEKFGILPAEILQKNSK